MHTLHTPLAASANLKAKVGGALFATGFIALDLALTALVCSALACIPGVGGVLVVLTWLIVAVCLARSAPALYNLGYTLVDTGIADKMLNAGVAKVRSFFVRK